MSVTGSVHNSFLFRLRFQVVGGLLLAVALPFIVRYSLLTPAEDSYQLYTSSIGSAVAFVIGVWILRNMTTYPGVEAASYVATAISTSYFILFAVLVIGRFPYNRAVVIAGWLISVLWFIAIYARSQRHRKLRIGVVPPCDPDLLDGIDGVTAIRLIHPDTERSKFDAVMADLRSDISSKWDAALADYALAGVPVYHLKHLRESLTGRVELEHLSENNFGVLAPRSTFMTVKTVIDWVIALLLGAMLTPLMAIVAIAISSTSPGPILFRQQRVGYQGKLFTVYKFRTMTVSAAGTESRDVAMTQDSDRRVTRVGRYLRRSRIDELPQILNILRGEMSWIGPRPEAAILSRWYQEEIPFYRYRHIVVPGLTGWAQVNQGHVTDVQAVKEKLQYDFYYIKNFSMWLDLLIINRTVATILSGFGAR